MLAIISNAVLFAIKLGVVLLLYLAASNTLDTSVFTNIVLAFVSLVSPLVLKYIPAHDFRMILVCLVVCFVLAIIGLLLSGGFALDWHSAEQVGIAMATFMGLMQTFYATFRDTFKLDTP